MRKITKFLLSLFIFLFLVIAALPMIVSTKSGTKALTSLVNSGLGGTVEIEDLHLSWLGRQEATNFIYRDKEGKEILSFSKFSTKTPLLSYLFTIRGIGETHLEDPHLVYSVDKEEKMDKPTSSRSRTHRPKRKLVGPLFIKEGELTLEKQESLSTHLSNIQVEFNEEENLFHIVADASQNGHTGSLIASGSFGAEAKALATLTNFPLTPFSLFDQTTWIPEALGPELSGELTLEKKEGKLTFATNLKSNNLDANLYGEEENQRFVFSKESKAAFTLTPSFFKEWFSLPDDFPLFLADKSTFTLAIEKLDFPLSLQEFSLAKTFAEMSFSATPLTIIYQDKSYTITPLTGSLKKHDTLLISYEAALQAPYESTLSGIITKNNRGEITSQTTIDKLPTSLIEKMLGIKEGSGLFGKSLTLTHEASIKEQAITSKATLTSDELDLSLELKGRELHNLTLSISGEYFFQGEKKELFGEKLALDIKGRMAFEKGRFGYAFIHGSATNPYLNIDIRGKLGKQGKPFSWDLCEIIVTGSIELPPLFTQTGISALAKAHSFYMHLEGSDNELLFDIDLTLFKAKGKVVNFIEEGKLNFTKASWDFSSQGRKMPVTILDALLPHIDFLPELLGPEITFTSSIKRDLEEDPHIAIELDASSEGFSAKASLQIDESLSVSEKVPTKIHYEITKERYLALLKHWPELPLPPYLLANQASLDFTITKLTCPKESSSNLKELLCKAGFVGEMTISPLTFVNREEDKQFTIEEIAATVEGEDFSKVITFNGGATFHTPYEEASQTAKVSCQGELTNLFQDDGSFDRVNAELQGTFSVDSLSTEALLGMVPLEQEIRDRAMALLGELVTATAEVNIKEHSGPISLALTASNFKANCPFYFTKERTLALRAPLQAEISLTHEINENIIKDINPLLISGIYSDHPLQLTISPDGFSFPIFPFHFRELSLGAAKLDIGKIEVVNGGEIQKTMEFVKAQELTEEGVMSAWFTPIYFSLSDGVVKYDRFDLLLGGNVHLAFWGRIDLNKDSVRMTMAISPDTLQRGLEIKGLTSGQMFHVKMRGSTANVELDWSAAKRRLGIIIASQAGGPIGSLVGSLVESIVKNLGESPTPPPTTQPFPWQK